MANGGARQRVRRSSSAVEVGKGSGQPCRAREHARYIDKTARSAGGLSLPLHAGKGGRTLEVAGRAWCIEGNEIQPIGKARSNRLESAEGCLAVPQGRAG